MIIYVSISDQIGLLPLSFITETDDVTKVDDRMLVLSTRDIRPVIVSRYVPGAFMLQVRLQD